MALIQCHFDYACPAWYSGLTKRMKNRLQCAQNKIIRYVLNLSPFTHIGLDEFKIVKMLPVEYRVQQLKLNHMYDIVNGIAPDYMSNLLEIPPIDHHITRNSTLSFAIPQVSTSGLTSFFYTGARLWNSLPSESKLSVSKNIFKSKINSMLRCKFESDKMNKFVT